VVVYISGAVMYPNVYEVRQTARITDVVNAAGGFTPDAASEQINLAAHVQDALHIHVPRIGEPPAASTAAAGPAAPPASTAAAIININTASAAELEALPGIGEALARRIVEYRTSNGPFAAVEDIQNVRGIGATMFAELRSRITIE
jgi:competence protein ComEA